MFIVGYSKAVGSKDEIDEGLRLGDYPVLPWRSAQEEKPRGWWDEQDRRDKETPVRMDMCSDGTIICVTKGR